MKASGRVFVQRSVTAKELGLIVRIVHPPIDRGDEVQWAARYMALEGHSVLRGAKHLGYSSFDA